MTHRCVQLHMEEHKKREDVNPPGPPPARLDAKEHWQRTPQEIQEYIVQLLARKVDNGHIRDNAPQTIDAKESGKTTDIWHKRLKQQAAALAEDAISRTTDISEETQAQILSYNLEQVEKGKFQYSDTCNPLTSKIQGSRLELKLLSRTGAACVSVPALPWCGLQSDAHGTPA